MAKAKVDAVKFSTLDEAKEYLKANPPAAVTDETTGESKTPDEKRAPYTITDTRNSSTFYVVAPNSGRALQTGAEFCGITAIASEPGRGGARPNLLQSLAAMSATEIAELRARLDAMSAPVAPPSNPARHERKRAA